MDKDEKYPVKMDSKNKFTKNKNIFKKYVDKTKRYGIMNLQNNKR